MAKTVIPFSEFEQAAGADHTEFVKEVDAFMRDHECACEIKEAKSGFVVSYIYKPTNHTVFNYVFRRKGMLIRIYGENAAEYAGILSSWPESMKAVVKKAGPCKRMLDRDACNSRCKMGFDFMMDGTRYQKCRNSGFMFLLDDESKPPIREMLEREIMMRELKCP